MITPQSRELVQRHREAGDVCVIITATNSFVTAPIAREFGIQHLIATEPEHKNGEFTGRVADVPCFREGKITRLTGWLNERCWTLAGFDDSTFYSDSHNDLPLMCKVRHPVAANPDASLRAHAEENGWPIISLR
jgi:HAD superfamily hydrolase (TIGR01490 family)